VEVEPLRPDGHERVWEWHAWDHLIQDFDPAAAHHGDVTAHPERIDINGDHRDEPPLGAEERAQLEEMEQEMLALGYLGGDEDDDAPAPPIDRDPGGHRDPGGGRSPGDWMHSNSIAYLPAHDLIVISVRRFDELWVIDHSTTSEEAASSRGGRFGHGGDLLYRWGNPRRYGLGTDEDQALFGQHDARWVVGADGSLSLTVFNNGSGRAGDWSSVDEILLPFHPERGFERNSGWPFGPESVAWRYGSDGDDGFYASFISGAERLPNGNTLIALGPQGRLVEVTRGGEEVWVYENPHHEADEQERAGGVPGNPGNMRPGGLYRGTRLAPDHPGLSRLKP
jgi:hypothetical protein